MTGIRRPVVAGRFYPRDPKALATSVDRLLDAVEVPGSEPLAGAYLVPHAGYVYSGPVAAHVYARLRRHRALVERVVLVGPSHFVPLTGCAVSASGAWATPLGELPVAASPTPELKLPTSTPTPTPTPTPELKAPVPVPIPELTVDDAPHAREHSLEVQLPFLQRALRRPVPILPIAVGRLPAAAVAAVLTAAAADPGTVVLCSTDLSHYLDQPAAAAQDARTAAAIEALAPDAIGARDACGASALRGLLSWARTAAPRPARLALATSADTGGDPARVVGYAAFAFFPS